RPATPTPAPAPTPQPKPAPRHPATPPPADTSVIEGLLGGGPATPSAARPAAPTPQPAPAPAPPPAPAARPASPAPAPNPMAPAAKANLPERRADEQPDTSFLETLIHVEEQERSDGGTDKSNTPRKG